MNILTNGAAGHIGFHACIDLLDAARNIIASDNHSSSHPNAWQGIAQIAGKYFPGIAGDIREDSALKITVRNISCNTAIHFADFTAAGEMCRDHSQWSMKNPQGSA